MEYTSIITFVKSTNLNKFLLDNVEECARKYNLDIRSAGAMEHLRKHYSKEQTVYLVAQFKFENGKTFCCIKCPINPLPVRGWFETPSVRVLQNSLVSMGWLPLQVLPNKVLK